MTIAQSISTFGFAPVLAYTKRAPSEDLIEHFSAHADSQLALAARRTMLSASRSPSSRQGRSPQAEPIPRARVYPRLGIVYGTVDREGLAALKRAPEVSKVTTAPQPSLIRPVGRAAAALRSNVTWGIRALGVPELWAAGLTGSGVKVAHLDTGIDGAHPSLQDALAAYAEFDVSGDAVADAEPRDSDRADGHGTHTAATIAGRAVKNKHVGVAPGAALYSAMVIEGGDVIARILSGMEWAVTEGVKVVSLSLGIRGYVNDFLGIVDALRDNGVFPVVAVGNEGPGTSRSPGNYPRVVSTGYLNETLAVADDSSSQRFPRRSQPLVPDLVAPGEGVISAAPGGGWRTLSGSSMAAPHVAGLAALLLEAHPTATVSKIERAILASAELGSLPADRANRGAVHGPRALAALERTMPRRP